MHLKPLFGVILTLILSSTSIAAPQEKTKDALTRSSAEGNTVRTELSLNVNRSEPYQDTYTEKVPYQAQEEYTVDIPYETTENYVVDIPYQDTETYTENVPYQETETYWEKVPYTERVPYTDYEEYYDNEYSCQSVTRYREQCHSEQLCVPGNRVCQDVTECGTNSRGEKICKTRTECRDSGERQCKDVPKCQQVPYQEQECGYRPVRKTRAVTRYRDETQYRDERRTRTVTKYRQETRTRTVTRYRQETRTRNVTKYRQETRTRTVTRYRDEQKCCVTRYRDVFDHQFTQPVSVVFPAEAALLAGEVEKIQVVLSGSEAQPKVSIQVKSDVFSYVVAEERQDGRDKVFVLALTPKFTGQNAGTETIQGLKLSFSSGQAKVSFKETLSSARLVSEYLVQIVDQQSQQVLFEQRASNTEAKIMEVVVPGLAREGKYNINLSVSRKGVNVAGGAIAFSQSAVYEKKELDQDEVKALSDKALVSLLSIQGQGADRVVIINDQTPDIEEISSKYKLVVWKKLASGKIEWLGEKNFMRNEIARAGSELGISLKAIGVNPSADTKLYMDLVVMRTSSQYLGSQKIQFIVSKTF